MDDYGDVQSGDVRGDDVFPGDEEFLAFQDDGDEALFQEDELAEVTGDEGLGQPQATMNARAAQQAVIDAIGQVGSYQPGTDPRQWFVQMQNVLAQLHKQRGMDPDLAFAYPDAIGITNAMIKDAQQAPQPQPQPQPQQQQSQQQQSQQRPQQQRPQQQTQRMPPRRAAVGGAVDFADTMAMRVVTGVGAGIAVKHFTDNWLYAISAGVVGYLAAAPVASRMMRTLRSYNTPRRGPAPQ